MHSIQGRGLAAAVVVVVERRTSFKKVQQFMNGNMFIVLFGIDAYRY